MDVVPESLDVAAPWSGRWEKAGPGWLCCKEGVLVWINRPKAQLLDS